ncbi:MAG: V-type ATP synthase subunit D [Candidatus Omnitrophica bacterium]|nr:V-type ATP synthase subunit D [Candidatus Omnitrophota bacterium]MCM8830767.1 V-type ATP synthase subunit D [Candidatus Omnitrophota bacterium]
MEKIKFTRDQLKQQIQLLEQYKRYLPILQLKKLQLQLEVAKYQKLIEEKNQIFDKRQKFCSEWIGLAKVDKIELKKWIKPTKINLDYKNIAGVEVPTFLNLEFNPVDYDIFIYPLWVDKAIDYLRELITIEEELKTIKKAIEILKEQLRITVQRVNLFEKIKIPQTQEAIRRIKIYLGDQFTNEVCRSKIAKKKLEKIYQG